MVRGIDRQQQEGTESVLQSASSGGLNVMSSSLSIPLQDSPSMKNTKVNQRGNIQKRRGSRLLATTENATLGVSGVSLDTIKLRNLPSILLAKTGVDLNVFSFIEGTAANNRESFVFSTNLNFDNVFSERARYVKPDTVETSELDPRVIMTTGVNAPVQITFVQSISFDVDYDSGDDESVVTFENSKLANASTDNIFVFADETDVTSDVSNVFFSSGSLEVTLDGDYSGREMSLVFVSWQWWAEASAAFGNSLYQRTNRFNSDETDKFVTLPTELLQGLQPLEDTPLERPRYPLIPTSSNQFGSYGSPNSPPFYDYEYILTNPGAFDVSVDTEVRVGLGDHRVW